MLLTELYYYYGNYSAAKAGNTRAFSCYPTTEKAASPAVLISASGLRRNRETAREFEVSLGRQSRNELTGKPQKKRDDPRHQTQSRP